LIARLLQEEVFEVLNLDESTPKIQEHEKVWNNCSVCDRSKLSGIVRDFNPDFVIHLAARTDLRGKNLQDYEANLQGVSNLLDALDSISNLKRVIFTSSMYVCEPGYLPSSFDDYKPHTVYGASKVETEKIIKARSTRYTWSIIRPTSIWGPWFGEPYDGFFRAVMKRFYFHLGSKACKKTYGYVDNAIFQILSILQAPEYQVKGKIFYLGDYEPYDISEWANEIADHEGFKIRRLPYPLFVLAGWLGDTLKLFGVKFPMTSFRLHNMTTDNVLDTSPIQAFVPNLPISRKEGNTRTLAWIKVVKGAR